MGRSQGWVVATALFSTALYGCGSKSPSGPSSPTETQRTAIAENVGSATMAALFSGGSQAGVGAAGLSEGRFPQGSAGQAFGTAPCPSGGRVDLIYVRTYVPADGVVDTSALKAVYVQCRGAGTSVQVSGDLAMSGMYQGTSQPATLRVSGTLTTSAGDCPIDGSLELTGVFNGTACGAQMRVTPPPRSAAAVAAVGTYSLSVLGGSSLPRVVVTRPCIGSMNTGGLALRGDGTYEITMFGSFACANGPGPNVSYAEPGTWALLGNNTIVFSTLNQRLFAASAATVSGSSVSVDLDVPSSAPDIPPTRMSAIFTK